MPSRFQDIELVNFKVRILDERKGTAAVTRVLLDASDGQDTRGSIGVSPENIIEASWEARGLPRGGHAPRPDAGLEDPGRSHVSDRAARPAAGGRA